MEDVKIKNKKGLIGKILIIVLLIIIIILFSKIGKADSFIYYDNISIIANGADFTINLSGNNFNFNYNNSALSNYSFNVSQPVTINFNSVIQNINNITSNVSCAANNTLQVSCSCPSLSCPSLVSNCSLASGSGDEFKKEIEDGYNKATEDIVFRLSASKVDIENYRLIAQNATDTKNNALLEANKQLEQNLRLGEVINTERAAHNAELSLKTTENILLFVADMIMFLVVVYLLSDAYGLFDRLRNLGFRRGGY